MSIAKHGHSIISFCYLSSFIFTARVCGKVMFSYWLCLSVQVITFECLDTENSFLVCSYILTISRSSLSTNAIGSRLLL